MDDDPIGYVVIEYNQASHMPDLVAGAYLHRDLESAQDELADHAERTKGVGRRETYQVAAVHLLEPEDDRG